MANKHRRSKYRARRNAPIKKNISSKKVFYLIRRYTPLILILFGCTVVVIVFFMWFYSSYRQKQLVQKYESSVEENFDLTDLNLNDINENETMDTSASNIDESDDSINDVQENEISKISISDRNIQLLGVLTIPKIDLTVAIGNGTDNSTLKYAVGHFNDTALPGEMGNSCIAGHRNYTWGKFFNRLDEIEVGDEILVERDETTYSYIVSDTFVVDPEDTWVLDQTEDAEITLITCTPMYSADHRLIIKGTLNN